MSSIAEGAGAGSDLNGGAGGPRRDGPLSPEAERALAEARERRAEYERRQAEAAREREINGPAGPEPVRYGDWEKGGRAYDF